MHFVIISSRRSGSSHFVNTLGGHPEIMCHGNVFASGLMPVFWPKDHPASPGEMEATKTELRDLRDSDPRAFLERVFATSHGRPHVGFKIFHRQNDKILRRVIKSSSVRKIVLVRGNLLARYSSQLAAHETGKWGGRQVRAEEAPKVCFDAGEFMRFCNNHTEYYASVLNRLLAKREPHHLVKYEDINDPLLLRRAINFIGADPDKPILESEQRKTQIKQLSSDIVSRFANVDELKEFLANHNLNSWAYEAETTISQMFPDSLGVDPRSGEKDSENGTGDLDGKSAVPLLNGTGDDEETETDD
jgi:hypothetical protein